ncbi:hypothetical protein J6590_086080 [Homalodisca vitripennis]|nr:hypothetical protein J6590_086080 [Homalodisca vitripennis]
MEKSWKKHTSRLASKDNSALKFRHLGPKCLDQPGTYRLPTGNDLSSTDLHISTTWLTAHAHMIRSETKGEFDKDPDVLGTNLLQPQSEKFTRMLQENNKGSYAELLKLDNGSLWRLEKTPRTYKRVESPLRGPINVVYSDTEMRFSLTAAGFSVFSKSITDHQHSVRVKAFLEKATVDDVDEGLPPQIEEEVCRALSKFRTKKAPILENIGSPAFRLLSVWTIS